MLKAWRKCAHARTPENTCRVSPQQPNGRCQACVVAYVASEQRRAALARYNNDALGRSARARYNVTAKGVFSRARRLLNARMREHAVQLGKLEALLNGA